MNAWPAKKNASGVLTGRRNIPSGTTFLTALAANRPKKVDHSSCRTPSLSQRTDLDSEEDIDLMLYLSQSNRKSSKTDINWGKIDALTEAVALSDVVSEVSLTDHNHFLKSKNLNKHDKENKANSPTGYKQRQSAVSEVPRKSYGKTTTTSATTTNDTSISSEVSPNNSHFFKKHIFELNEVEVDFSSLTFSEEQRLSSTCEDTEIQTETASKSDVSYSFGETSEKLFSGRGKVESDMEETSTKSIAESVSENLESTLAVYAEEIEESAEISELDDTRTISSQVSLTSENDFNEVSPTIALNELSSVHDSVVTDGRSVSSPHYTMEFESASVSSDTGNKSAIVFMLLSGLRLN